MVIYLFKKGRKGKIYNMEKNLYSLILTDEVVRRIDNAANEMGTNRSNLINQILADYVSYTTPEMRIKHIFEHIFDLLAATSLQPCSERGEKSIAVKTSLDSKYRPTIRYNVELYKKNGEQIGELKVSYRTQSEELLYKIRSFFSEIMSIEKKFLTFDAAYTLSEGKFIRTFVIPYGTEYTQEEVARAISDYIKNFDCLLKKFLLEKYASRKELESDYRIYLSKSILI